MYAFQKPLISIEANERSTSGAAASPAAVPGKDVIGELSISNCFNQPALRIAPSASRVAEFAFSCRALRAINRLARLRQASRRKRCAHYQHG